MTPGSHDFVIPMGATLNHPMTVDINGVLLDLTDYTARMQARVSYASGTTVLNMTTANSQIVLGGTAGTIVLKLTASQTAALTAGVYVYDLELVSPSGEVTRLLEGTITVTPEVTR